MGRTGQGGVEIRGASIRLLFTFEGKRHRHTLMINGEPMKPSAPNIRFATRLAGEIGDRIRHGTFSMAEYFPAAGIQALPLTVAQQLDTWLAGQRIEHSTRAGYESAVKFWKSAPCDAKGAILGELGLRALRVSHLLLAVAARRDLAGKTINNYVSVLREALALAVLDKMLSENPAVSIPRAKQQKPTPDPFTSDETESIIEDMRTHYPEPIYNLVEWWFFTGVRTSEMAGLKWPQVDLASGYVQIREALVRGVHKGSTKTGVVREVHLGSRALAALSRQRAHTSLAGVHVWADPRYGTPWNEERAFRRSYWEPTLKRLGIRYRRPYDMRHTYATTMLMAGMAPAFCAGQLGHSVEIFHSTYAKWIPGSGDLAEMAKLEASTSRRARLAPEFVPGLSPKTSR